METENILEPVVSGEEVTSTTMPELEEATDTSVKDPEVTSTTMPELEEATDTSVKDPEETAEIVEGDLDISDPDKTPKKYQALVEENNKLVGAMANEIMDKYVMTSDIPYAFIEILPQVLNGKIKVIKGRSKDFEEINKLSNKAHLTPVKDMDLYEYTQTDVNDDEDMGGE